MLKDFKPQLGRKLGIHFEHPNPTSIWEYPEKELCEVRSKVGMSSSTRGA
jgi:hypothetical protein